MRLNSAFPTGWRDPDAALATNRVEMVSKISSEIRASLRMEVALARASGSLESTITVILSILGDLDADNLREALSSQHGNAFIGKTRSRAARAAATTVKERA